MADACKRFGCFKRALSDGWCADHHEVLTFMADDRQGPTYADVLVAERDEAKRRLAAAEARAEKAEGEVAYLRELRDWSRECARRARAADRPGKERAYMEWLESHSPPTPPQGVEP